MLMLIFLDNNISDFGGANEIRTRVQGFADPCLTPRPSRLVGIDSELTQTYKICFAYALHRFLLSVFQSLKQASLFAFAKLERPLIHKEHQQL